MQAIEFVTTSKDGTIKIPKQYLNDLKKEFRVIILIDSQEKKIKKNVKKGLKSLKIKTKNFDFDREDANAR